MIEELLADLKHATSELDAAEQKESIARKASTDARNRVNDLQKKLDIELRILREAAPRSTDWKREKGLPAA